MLIRDGAIFTDQLFQCYSAVDLKKYEYAEVLIWLMLADLNLQKTKCQRELEYHREPNTVNRSVIESALYCVEQRISIINHVYEDLEEHRPW